MKSINQEDLKLFFNNLNQYKFNIVIIVLLLILLWVINKLITRIFNKLSEKYTSRRILIKNMIPIVKFFINFSVLAFIIFGLLKFSKNSLVAFGISAGVAIGFAVQDLLSNVFGGFVIIVSRPFNIGDKIAVGEYYGEVTDINLLRVKIVTPDDSVISIPSKTILTQSLSNTNSGALDCQVVTKMMLPGNIDIPRIKKIAWEAVYTSPYLFKDKPIAVLFKDEFKESALVQMTVKAYVFDHRYEFKFSSDVYERIKNYLNENGLIPAQFYQMPEK